MLTAAMPTRKPPVPRNADDPAQSQRFIDMAREVEADETPGALIRALRKAARPSVPKREPAKGNAKA
jgi:hypothetical protein